MIARRLLLFVAAVVLFVHDHQPELLNRRKYTRTRSHNYASLPVLHATPLIGPLRIAKCRVQNRDLLAEAVEELPRHRRRQSDLRDQQQSVLTQFKRRFDAAQIDFRLAGPCHALKKKRFELIFFESGFYGVERFLLVWIEHRHGALKAAGGW